MILVIQVVRRESLLNLNCQIRGIGFPVFWFEEIVKGPLNLILPLVHQYYYLSSQNFVSSIPCGMQNQRVTLPSLLQLSVLLDHSKDNNVEQPQPGALIFWAAYKVPSGQQAIDKNIY
jgi:hypothetical protein